MVGKVAGTEAWRLWGTRGFHAFGRVGRWQSPTNGKQRKMNIRAGPGGRCAPKPTRPNKACIDRGFGLASRAGARRVFGESGRIRSPHDQGHAIRCSTVSKPRESKARGKRDAETIKPIKATRRHTHTQEGNNHGRASNCSPSHFPRAFCLDRLCAGRSEGPVMKRVKVEMDIVRIRDWSFLICCAQT